MICSKKVLKKVKFYSKKNEITQKSKSHSIKYSKKYSKNKFTQKSYSKKLRKKVNDSKKYSKKLNFFFLQTIVILSWKVHFCLGSVILGHRGWVPLRAALNLEGAADARRLRRRAPPAGYRVLLL